MPYNNFNIGDKVELTPDMKTPCNAPRRNMGLERL